MTDGALKRKAAIGYRRTDGDITKICLNCNNLTVRVHDGDHFHKCRLIGTKPAEDYDVRLSYTCDRFTRDGIL